MHRFFESMEARTQGEPIMQIAELIDWQPVENHMQGEHWRELFRKAGRLPYDHRAMFRALLLARWHGLSFPKLERALRLRLDFLLFCGFGPDGKLPSACTLSRFKARLAERGAFEAMAAEVERQLHAKGWTLRPAADALDDLTLAHAGR
jgi:IS5 family transposase